MTLSQSLYDWAAFRALSVKPRTRRYHQEIIQSILRDWPAAADRDVGTISEQEVKEFAEKVSRYSPSRFNAIVCALRVTVPAASRLKRRAVRLKDRALLSQLEFTRLLDELDKRPQSNAGLVIRFLAHTGLRINEARKLKWRDVQADYILAPGTITKNGLPRQIPFVNGIRSTLDALRRIDPEAELVLPQSECKRSLQTACRLAGMARLSHHDFRHLFATRCIQSGVDLPTVARWLGHQDGGALLAKTYYHLADEHSRAMAAKVEI